MRVALFTTCLVDAMVPQVAEATVTLLRRLGVEAEVPPDHTCCGQMHVNTGYPAFGAAAARHNARVLSAYDAIVLPSGSCAASVRHQWPAEAAETAAKAYELSEFLVDVLGVVDVGAYYPHRVTWHPTCHSLRELRVGDRPLRLLQAVEGMDLVELPDATSCCGFGGMFAVKNSAVSSAMLEDKTAAIASTGAAVCAAGDSSCLMHIAGGLSRTSAPARTVHLAEVLAATKP